MEKYDVEMGKFYHFWDDGKSSISRHYLCKCEDIITLEQAEKLLIPSLYWSKKNGETVTLTLKEIWERNKKECDWLYADETPYFIVISCPKYDDNLLYCAKTKYNEWFSMSAQTWWQSGLLDIYEKKLNQVIKDNEDYINNYDLTDSEINSCKRYIEEHKNVKY